MFQLSAQTNFLSGHIQGKEFTEEGKVTFMVFDESSAKLGWLSQREPDTIINALLSKDGKFEIEFTPNSTYFYFKISFYIGDNEIKELRQDFLFTPILGKSGDSVHVKINLDRERVEFKGIGADKLNCQYLLNRLKEPSEIRGPYYFMRPFNKVQPFYSFEKIYLANLAYRNSIIDQFNSVIDRSSLEIIRKNVEASIKHNFASFMVFSAASLSANVSDALIKFFSGKDSISTLLREDSTLVDSPIYSDFILYKSELKYRVENRISKLDLIEQDEKKHYFDWMYNFLKNSYSGSLRDRLIISWFLKTSRNYYKLQSPVISEALSIIHEKKYLKDLNQYASSNLGNQVYNFEFIDENDNIHSAEDYSDKILIMDFWFSGCVSCTDITPKLKIIREEFKDRDDVVFLSINVESSKEGWKNGLKSGLYTFPGQIHLKTPSHGRSSPFIMNYHIQSYPHLMVVGKNGDMLSVSPNDPRIDNGYEIIQIVKQALKNK